MFQMSMSVNIKDADLRAASKFVNDLIKGPLLIAEVGTCQGKNAVRMLRGMNIDRLYLIDSYPDYTDGTHVRKSELQENYYRVMFTNIQPYLSKITLVTKDSLFAAELFKNGAFDFVYIDGWHNYTQVKKDMEAWWPKVKKGGVLGGHDIGHIEFPGVAKAVEGFSKDFKVEFKCVGESDWVIIKD